MFEYLKERMYAVASRVKKFHYELQMDAERELQSTAGPFPVQTGPIRVLADEYHAMIKKIRRKNQPDSKNSEDITDKL